MPKGEGSGQGFFYCENLWNLWIVITDRAWGDWSRFIAITSGRNRRVAVDLEILEQHREQTRANLWILDHYGLFCKTIFTIKSSLGSAFIGFVSSGELVPRRETHACMCSWVYTRLLNTTHPHNLSLSLSQSQSQSQSLTLNLSITLAFWFILTCLRDGRMWRGVRKHNHAHSSRQVQPAAMCKVPFNSVALKRVYFQSRICLFAHVSEPPLVLPLAGSLSTIVLHLDAYLAMQTRCAGNQDSFRFYIFTTHTHRVCLHPPN